MKNITLAVDEDILVRVRRIAAAQDTTVNALVRDYLVHLAAQDDRARRARERLIELSEQSTWDPGSGAPKREELYDRAVLRRHERPGVSGFSEPTRRLEEGESD